MASIDVITPTTQTLPGSLEYQSLLLRSSEGEYIGQQYVGLLDETTLDTPLEEMRRRFNEKGYVFIKDLIPRVDVLDFREHYFELMRPTGILKSGSHPRDGIFNDDHESINHEGIGGRLEDENSIEVLKVAHRTPEYLAFSQHPALREFVRQFMGWNDDVECVRTLLRHNVPKSMSTGIHYDQIFLRAGPAEFLTAWVPIGDCAINGGGLLYLEDSTEIGKKIESNFTEQAQGMTPEQRISAFNANMQRGGFLSRDAVAFGQKEGEGKRWLIATFEAGDVVFHNPWIVHTSARNEDPEGRIRLSTDLRFYEKGAPMDERWMNFWFPNDGL